MVTAVTGQKPGTLRNTKVADKWSSSSQHMALPQLELSTSSKIKKITFGNRAIHTKNVESSRQHDIRPKQKTGPMPTELATFLCFCTRMPARGLLVFCQASRGKEKEETERRTGKKKGRGQEKERNRKETRKKGKKTRKERDMKGRKGLGELLLRLISPSSMAEGIGKGQRPTGT